MDVEEETHEAIELVIARKKGFESFVVGVAQVVISRQSVHAQSHFVLAPAGKNTAGSARSHEHQHILTRSLLCLQLIFDILTESMAGRGREGTSCK